MWLSFDEQKPQSQKNAAYQCLTLIDDGNCMIHKAYNGSTEIIQSNFGFRST